MIQQAFGFVPLTPIPEGFAPQPVASAPPRGSLVSSLKQPFLNSPRVGRVGTIREQLSPLHIASHTRPRTSSRKNPAPSHSTGCASRSARPCNDAAPAELQTIAPRRNTP